MQTSDAEAETASPGALRSKRRYVFLVVSLLALGVRLSLAFVRLHSSAHPVPTAAGFPGKNNAQAPAVGTWRATGVVTRSNGYSDSYIGAREVRVWHIAKSCQNGQCGYTLTVELARSAPLTTELVYDSDGWHASFPIRKYLCHETSTEIIYWPQQYGMVLRFSDRGDQADANGVFYSQAPRCGYGEAFVRWHATHLDQALPVRSLGHVTIEWNPQNNG